MADLNYSVGMDTRAAERALTGLQSLAVGVGGAIAGAFATVSLGRTLTQFQDLRTSLQILYKDTQLGSRAFEEVKQFAAETAFSVQDLTETVIKLKAAGIDPTVARLKLFADVSAVTADKLGALQAITDLYARTTAGGLGLEDLNRLQDRGIPVFDIIAQKTGLARLEIAKMGQTAEGARIILQALESGLSETFSGASEARAKNLSQALSNLGDTIDNVIDLVGQTGLTDSLTNLAKAFENMVVESRGLIVVFGVGLTEAIQLVADNIKLFTAAAIAFFAVMSVQAILGLVKAFTLFNSVLGKNPLVKLIGLASGLAAGLGIAGLASDELGESMKKLDEEIAKLDQNKGAKVITEGKLADGSQNFRQQLQGLNEQLNKFRVEMESAVQSFARYNQESLAGLKLETELIGATSEMRRLRQAELDINQRAVSEIAKLREAKAKLTEQEKKEGRGEIIDQTIKKIQEQAQADIKATEQAIKNSEARQMARQVELFGIQNRIDKENQLQQIQDDIAKSTMTEIEQKYYDIEQAAKRAAKAAIEAEEARLGRRLTGDEARAYYDEAIKGAEQLKKKTEEQYNVSRTWANGWRRAFNDYVSNATNAAKQAENIFKKATQGMEDAIVNFAKTGKFEWKQFVAMMLEELLRAQIQQIFAQLMTGMQNQIGGARGGGGGGFLDSLLGGLGGLFGGGNAATAGTSASNPLYVVDITGGGGSAGSIFGGGGGGMASGGGIGGGMGSIFGSIGSAVGSAWEGIKSVGSSIWDTVSSIGSGIGDLFAGFFANGGTIPGGKFGVVGENGPEFVSGPATVTPMTGGANVTYNINAVDALSFKQLLAQDPSFIYSLSLQGSGQIPSRR
jgi:lambda family phage tail tape measure protein